MTRTITISNRSRNLGLGFTTDLVRGANGRTEIADVKSPMVDYIGGPAAVRRGMARHAKVCSGGVESRMVLFVGGEPVREAAALVMMWLETGPVTVTIG